MIISDDSSLEAAKSINFKVAHPECDCILCGNTGIRGIVLSMIRGIACLKSALCISCQFSHFALQSCNIFQKEPPDFSANLVLFYLSMILCLAHVDPPSLPPLPSSSPFTALHQIRDPGRRQVTAAEQNVGFKYPGPSWNMGSSPSVSSCGPWYRFPLCLFCCPYDQYGGGA